MAQYMKVEQYINQFFVEGSKPDKRTIIAAVDNEELPGTRIGRQYFIDVEPMQAKPKTGNRLADKVLESLGRI